MKRDLRRQTFSKPVKPDNDEINRLTSDASDDLTEAKSTQETRTEEKALAKRENASSKKNGASSADDKSTNNRDASTSTSTSSGEKANPFLLSRGQTSEIGVEKTGYRLRSDYMDLLKLVKRMKKGYTLEAVLDDALTFYFENSEDGRKAVKHRELLDSE